MACCHRLRYRQVSTWVLSGLTCVRATCKAASLIPRVCGGVGLAFSHTVASWILRGTVECGAAETQLRPSQSSMSSIFDNLVFSESLIAISDGQRPIPSGKHLARLPAPKPALLVQDPPRLTVVTSTKDRWRSPSSNVPFLPSNTYSAKAST